MTEEKKIEQPEIVTAVLEEVKKLGAVSRENFDTLSRNYEELKKAVETLKSNDPVLEEKISKLSADIVTRQEAIDKAMAEQTKKLDEFKLSLQRKGPGSPPVKDEEIKEAMEFKSVCASVRRDRVEEDYVITDADVEAVRTYKRKFVKMLRQGKENCMPDELKTLSVGSDPDGGYTVTPTMSARIVVKLMEEDPIRQLAAIETITTDAMEFGNDTQECEGGWAGETDSRSDTTTAKLGQKRVPVHEQYAKPLASQKLLEDSSINIENWLANKVAEKFARLEGAAFVTGQGVITPRGFLTYSDGSAWGTIEQVHMGSATVLTADGFIKVMTSMIEQYIGRGTWLMNRTTVRAALLLKDGDGQYIWRPGLQAGIPSTILGIPVRMSTTMPVVAANAKSVVLADWKEAYLIVDRLGITTLRDPYTNPPFVKFYTRRRVGGDVINYQAIKIGTIEA